MNLQKSLLELLPQKHNTHRNADGDPCPVCGEPFCAQDDCISETVRRVLEEGQYELDPQSVAGRLGIARRIDLS